METNIEELKVWRDDARRGLRREMDQLREKEEQIDECLKAMEVMDELLAEIDDLRGELEDRQLMADNLRAQLQEEKERAKKSSQDDILKAMRSYLNISRRKTQSKREAAKMVFMELFASAQMELPEDIVDSLAHLDDELSEAKVVNVTGNYNDIHDNGDVNMRD